MGWRDGALPDTVHGMERDCPDCLTHMMPFWVPGRAPNSEVELDRCNDCGGVWFDAGELFEASGRKVEAGQQETDRSCPECGISLVDGELRGGVEVETCVECAGTFLEARDLDAIVKRAAPKAKAPGGTGFVCDGCHQRRPFSEAQATLTGLECQGCVLHRASPPAPPEKAKGPNIFGAFLGWLRGE